MIIEIVAIVFTVVFEIVGFAVGYGMLKQKSKDSSSNITELKNTITVLEDKLNETKIVVSQINAVEIKEKLAVLENKQDQTESVVSNINARLGSIDTKLDLLINGKIIIKDGE